MNVETFEYKNISFVVSDIAGKIGFRRLYRIYYEQLQCQGIIYVIDSNDRERIDDTYGMCDSCKEELHRLLAEDIVRDAKLLVFGMIDYFRDLIDINIYVCNSQ